MLKRRLGASAAPLPSSCAAMQMASGYAFTSDAAAERFDIDNVIDEMASCQQSSYQASH